MIVIEPYQSVGAIRFGMNIDAVLLKLGAPKTETPNRSGNSVLRYEGIYVTVAEDGVAEVELLPSVKAVIGGIDIFGDGRSFRRLIKLDGDPQICVGAIIMFKLGISMTGFHDKNESQKSVSAFAKGRFEVLRGQMSPFNHSAD